MTRRPFLGPRCAKLVQTAIGRRDTSRHGDLTHPRPRLHAVYTLVTRQLGQNPLEHSQKGGPAARLFRLFQMSQKNRPSGL